MNLQESILLFLWYTLYVVEIINSYLRYSFHTDDYKMLNDSLSNLKGSIWCVLAGKKITRFYRLSFTLLFISFLMHKWKRDLTSAFFGIWIHWVVHRNRYASVMHQCTKWMLRFLKQPTTYFWLFFLYEKDKILLLSYNSTLTLIEHASPL